MGNWWWKIPIAWPNRRHLSSKNWRRKWTTFTGPFFWSWQLRYTRCIRSARKLSRCTGKKTQSNRSINRSRKEVSSKESLSIVSSVTQTSDQSYSNPVGIMDFVMIATSRSRTKDVRFVRWIFKVSSR